MSFINEVHAVFPDSAIPIRRQEYRVKRIPCCYLLQDEDGKNVLKLNETGLLIWELCNGDISVGEMLQLLKESFPEAAAEMEKDVFRVLDEFKEGDVITIASV